MKIFTNDEKKVITFLMVFLFFGLVFVNAKKMLQIAQPNVKVQDSLKQVIKKSNIPQKINVNEADIETFAELPGIGPKKAKRIYDYREQNGKFESLIELTNIKGIGKKTLAKLLPNLLIIGDSVKINSYISQNLNQYSKSKSNHNNSIIVNINNATITDLKTLYRIGDKTAKAIIDYREKNGKFTKKEEIKKVKGIGEGIYNKIKNKIEI